MNTYQKIITYTTAIATLFAVGCTNNQPKTTFEHSTVKDKTNNVNVWIQYAKVGDSTYVSEASISDPNAPKPGSMNVEYYPYTEGAPTRIGFLNVPKDSKLRKLNDSTLNAIVTSALQEATHK